MQTSLLWGVLDKKYFQNFKTFFFISRVKGRDIILFTSHCYLLRFSLLKQFRLSPEKYECVKLHVILATRFKGSNIFRKFRDNNHRGRTAILQEKKPKKA